MATTLRSALAIGAMLALTLARSVSAQQSSDSQPTLLIGTTILKLGMTREFLVPALSLQYQVEGLGDTWFNIKTKTAVVGFIEFDDQGKLAFAAKVWTGEFRPYSEGDIGKALVSIFASFASEGRSECALKASYRNAVDQKSYKVLQRVAERTAVFDCGGKKVRLMSTSKDPDKDSQDSLQINEEIGLQRSEQR